MSTDEYVVQPPTFPGGTLGDLAAHTAGIGVVIAPTAVGPIRFVRATQYSSVVTSALMELPFFRFVAAWEFEVEVTSGTAAVWPAVEALRDAQESAAFFREISLA